MATGRSALLVTIESIGGHMTDIPRGAPGCTCGEPPFAPPEASPDCPYHGGLKPQDVRIHRSDTGNAILMTIDHDKGRSIYIFKAGWWRPTDLDGAGAMRDWLSDL